MQTVSHPMASITPNHSDGHLGRFCLKWGSPRQLNSALNSKGHPDGFCMHLGNHSIYCVYFDDTANNQMYCERNGKDRGVRGMKLMRKEGDFLLNILVIVLDN